MKLTERDVALLQDLHAHRYLSVGQVQRLHFPSEQTTYRRLRTLRAAGLVRTFQVPGVDESLVTLGKAGAAQVAGALGRALAELSWSEKADLPKDHCFTRHTIAVNDVWISLRQACARGDVRLLGFIPDAQGARSQAGGATRYIRDAVTVRSDGTGTISHTPDAAFALARGDRAALFFLEVDRGTEVVSDPARGVLKSIRFYVQYLTTGGYQRYARDFGVGGFRGFRALYVTTSESRAASIRDAAGAAEGPAKARRFLWVATFEQVERSGVLGCTWRSLDRRDEARYAIIGQEPRAAEAEGQDAERNEEGDHGE
jgi:hypothetical protein